MSNSQIPFQPLGPTVAITANATPPTGVQVPVDLFSNTQNYGQYRICNFGTVTVFLGYGNTAAEAAANSVTPAPSARCIPLAPGSVEVLRFGPTTFFSGFAASAATLYMTPGQGV